jgi:TonB family protein
MSYRALLFCPDEKTARTVTQVLGELEFAVEACLEPFAAVKKLMGEHFDAIVVDCDNEQNATLLFKSARSSTSNQASLAVAVVEGQAGVAKAFRIGANLVLTKPINIEQSKGTLRVARGLLRKGDPAKPGIPVANATAAAPSKPAAPARPAVAASTAAVPARPAASPAKPIAPAARTAVASSVPSTPPSATKETLPEISVMEQAAASAAPTAPRPVLGSHAASIDITSGFQPSSAAVAASYSSGAASAPAPAREVPSFPAVEISPASAPKETVPVLDPPAEAVASESSSSHASHTSFTFGGANLPVESSGGSKKILLGVAAVIVVAGVLYAGWSYFQGRPSQPTAIPANTAPAPAAAPASIPASTSASTTTSAQPVSAALKPAAASVASTSPSSSAKPAAQPPADGTSPDAEENDSVTKIAAGSSKPASSASSAGGKSAAAKEETTPLVVKGGSASAIHTKPVVPDTAAPSLIGMATGAGAPPPNLVGSTPSRPAPVLQTLNISQGVSQGLLVKKVQPIYPRNALTMHVEGAVDLLATISTTGNITAVKVVSGEPLLTKAAADAVKQWKYKPYLLNGEPVEIQTQITVNFKLPH